jgi:hypothetical protein
VQAAIARAQAKRKEELDAKKAVPLTQEDMESLQGVLLSIVAFSPTGDAEADKET